MEFWLELYVALVMTSIVPICVGLKIRKDKPRLGVLLIIFGILSLVVEVFLLTGVYRDPISRVLGYSASCVTLTELRINPYCLRAVDPIRFHTGKPDALDQFRTRHRYPGTSQTFQTREHDQQGR